MSAETIAVTKRPDGTALLTIDRAEKRNAMNRAFFREVHEVMDDLDADPDVVAAVITGAGEAFSAGGDIADFHALRGIQSFREQPRAALQAFNAIERAETVVIAAVNGMAFAGGTELTLACDMAVAGEDARFSFREVTIGLMPAYGLVRGPEVIGRPWTRRLAMTGETIDAAKAERIGLVQEVVAPDHLVEHALALAAQIASRSALAVGVGKRFLNRALQGDGLPEAVEMTALLFASEEVQTAVASFLAARGTNRP